MSGQYPKSAVLSPPPRRRHRITLPTFKTPLVGGTIPPKVRKVWMFFTATVTSRMSITCPAGTVKVQLVHCDNISRCCRRQSNLETTTKPSFSVSGTCPVRFDVSVPVTTVIVSSPLRLPAPFPYVGQNISPEYHHNAPFLSSSIIIGAYDVSSHTIVRQNVAAHI